MLRRNPATQRMNDQSVLADVANKLIDRWKLVMSEGQKAKDAQNEIVVNIYQQERRFLETLIDGIQEQLPTRLEEWETYRQRPAPDILFSPDSTFVQPRF